MTRLGHIFAAIVIVVCAGTMLVAQTTTATTSFDRSTPRGAIKALRAAMESGDDPALRDLLYAADDDRRKMNEALAKVIAASARVSLAANARFSASGDPIAGKAFTPADFTGIDSAPISEIDKDTATIDLPDRDRPLTLKRGSDRLWRIDLLEFSGATLDQLPQQLEMLHEFAGAMNELARDTGTGRFLSIADLKAAIQDRVHGTIAKSMRPPRATSAPSTKPTSAPGSDR